MLAPATLLYLSPSQIQLEIGPAGRGALNFCTNVLCDFSMKGTECQATWATVIGMGPEYLLPNQRGF